LTGSTATMISKINSGLRMVFNSVKLLTATPERQNEK
jgi:hypothetical protein